MGLLVQANSFHAGAHADAQHELSVFVHRRAFRVRSGDARKAFWGRVAAGLWEPQTFEVFQRFLRPDRSYIDVGAWIGPTVLYGALLSRRVHALEPDPVAFAELAANVDANPALRRKIHLHPCGIGPENGPLRLYAGGLYFGEQSHFGDSMSGMLAAPGAVGQPCREVPGMDLERFLALNAIDDCNFIKMDIEGGEYAVIPGLWRRLPQLGLPTLYVSFHAPEPARREALIRACAEELLLCYPRFYSAVDARGVALAQLLDAVGDWGDEAPGSPWRKLEMLLGAGLVASHEAW
ncbi:FkbM family methyltransferase [Polaromonas sp. YR568]|uniref:FkbM family methyltransferase n=1 Tax=Polaromonas sp. YR568 TaxID=1855301 RepID=UPI00398BC1F7